MELHATLQTQIKTMEKRVAEVNLDHEQVRRLRTLPEWA
jgi:hypothetical protein